MVQYTGNAGQGLGLLVFDTGIIAGVEILGGLLDGTYQHDPRTNTLRSQITWRAGMIPGLLAQNGRLITPGMTLSVDINLPNDLDTEVSTDIDTPEGPLRLTFRKIRGFSN